MTILTELLGEQELAISDIEQLTSRLVVIKDRLLEQLQLNGYPTAETLGNWDCPESPVGECFYGKDDYNWDYDDPSICHNRGI